MADSNERYCEWRGCTSKASKHLTYTEPGEVTDINLKGATMVMRIHHLDLCDVHLPETQRRVGGDVLELTEKCSIDCPTQS